MITPRKLFVRLFPMTFLKILFYATYHRPLDIKNPKSYYEKLIWLNFYEQSSLKSICADKLAVRNHLKNKGLSQNLNHLLSVYESADEIDFEKLPEKFVLKCTHGSGMNILCNDKSKLNIKKTKKLLNRWLNQRHSDSYGELHYKDIKPMIICEKYLGDDIIDYKVYCFHGVPKYIMLCIGRYECDLKWYLYDFDWNYVPFLKHYLTDPKISKPKNIDDIFEFTAKLSSEFAAVRVDFYNIEEKIIFGEITFTPSAFRDKETSKYINLYFGSLIDINKI